MRTGRLTLVLYNSYDPIKFTEAHRRALARAAPIAFWLNCNLAVLDFPFPSELRTPKEISDFICDSTSIGKGGQYLEELAKAGRFMHLDMPKNGFPPQLGLVVLTTSRPWEDRAVDCDFVAGELAKGRSVCLVFGLGPRGVKDSFFELCRQHLDVTDQGIPLETCTALASVPVRIMTLLGKYR